MTTTVPLSIHALTNRILDETSLSDPQEIAETLACMIPDEERHGLVVEALAHRVRAVIGTRRNAAMANAFTQAASEPEVDGSIITSPVVCRRPVRSTKVAGIRNWWQEMLRERIHVGAGTWTMLGQCGVKELEFAERYRRDQAEKEVAVAEKLHALRILLDEHKVRTVADLPPEAARKVWA